MSENRIIPESFGTSGTQDANYLWGILNNCSDDYLLQIVHLFFQQINGMEAFFYYMMSKRCLVKNMLPITQRYLSSLNPVKIIPHLVDGWEDFFLKSNSFSRNGYIDRVSIQEILDLQLFSKINFFHFLFKLLFFHNHLYYWVFS